MNKTRITGRIIAGAVASALLLAGALSAPAQARDTGWGSTSITKTAPQIKEMRDTGWGSV